MNPPSRKSGSGDISRRLIGRVVFLTLCRIVVSTARRFAYPFAPALGRGLGVPLTAVTSIIAANNATTLLGIVCGPLTDRIGYRRMMLAGLALVGAGMLLGGLLPFYWAVFAALLLAGVGKSVFDPAVLAHVSGRVPFHRRGSVIGLLETSWAACTLVGIPLIGILIGRLGWQSPFRAMGALALLGFLALFFILPKDAPAQGPGTSLSVLFQAWRSLAKERAALGACGFAFFVSIANDNFFVVYGAWMETAFQLSPVAIGFGTIAIGVAELCGETFTVFFSDRFGLKRAVLAGVAVSAASYGLLPLVQTSLPLALATLFLIFITFEYTFVSFISLCTELMPSARATMMAGIYASAGIGRVLGALSGIPVWLWGGIGATALVSVLLAAAGLACMAWGLKNRHRL